LRWRSKASFITLSLNAGNALRSTSLPERDRRGGDGRSGEQSTTLADARAYILTLPEGEHSQPRWQSVARKLLIACEDGDVEAVTRQIEFALFLRAKLVLR
jgi:hypothetical protein